MRWPPSVSEREEIQPGQDFLCLFCIRLLHADQHFVQDCFCKELMVYLLHDHIAGVQPIFRTVSLAVPDYLAASLLQPAEAPGKGGLASPVITNDAYNAAGRNRAILYVQDC